MKRGNPGCRMVVAFFVVAGAKAFHAYRENDTLGAAITAVWENPDRSHILVNVLCVGVSFLGYHLCVAADRRLGKGTLWRALWGRDWSPSAAQTFGSAWYAGSLSTRGV